MERGGIDNNYSLFSGRVWLNILDIYILIPQFWGMSDKIKFRSGGWDARGKLF